jgi:hypothetical protein
VRGEERRGEGGDTMRGEETGKNERGGDRMGGERGGEARHKRSVSERQGARGNKQGS